jgi:hypothetical protein
MNNCTDSNDGRRLETSLDSRLESEPPFPPGNFSRVVAPGDGHAPGRGVPACGTARAGAYWLPVDSIWDRGDEALFFVPGAGGRGLVKVIQ